MGFLVLEDGAVFEGRIFGYQSESVGEVVFQSGMVGYTEALTDPSYKSQILVFTYPIIGNYGVPAHKIGEFGIPLSFESEDVHVSGLIISSLSNIKQHWLADKTLEEWLKQNHVVGLCDVDTRALTIHIREKGTMAGRICFEPTEWIPIAVPDNLLAQVSVKEPKVVNEDGKYKIVAVDCGMKNNQVRCLVKRNARVKVVPYTWDFTNEDCDGIFLSNGPGNPEDCFQIVEKLRYITKRDNPIPIFGICLGHQLLALSGGMSTYKLKFGNRGHNQPCILSTTNRCFITMQNHGYAVNDESLPEGWCKLFTNANDHSNEGLYHVDKPFFGVQFHPEHNGGPEDVEWLFDVFIELIQQRQRHVQRFDIMNCIKAHLNISESKKPGKYRKVLILGSGGVSIGQAGEFDYSGSQAIKALKEEGINTILINANVATVQTSPLFMDKVYFLPITPEYVTQVIEYERPDGIMLAFGGQTALNCGLRLNALGVFNKYGITVLGTSLETINICENRQLFSQSINKLGYRTAESATASSITECCSIARKIGYPVLVRSGYSLGGKGSGFAHNDEELIHLVTPSLIFGGQVAIDKSLKGWKEVEYEVIRDKYDNVIAVCNMENVDPVGIHTGESIVVAPSQTLTNYEYHTLRTVSIAIARHFRIMGECNVQFALDHLSSEFYVIEVNARLSRSSALASKATGYPLAYIAAKLSLGHVLYKLVNSVTGLTTACFEPSLDYCVVKIPRWDLEKFSLVNKKLGSSMKSVGEVMAIDRCFASALQKAIRMASNEFLGFEPLRYNFSDKKLSEPTDKRIFYIATALCEGYSIDRLYELTKIDTWFLSRMKEITDLRSQITEIAFKNDEFYKILLKAKKFGYGDKQIGRLVNCSEINVRNYRKSYNIKPFVKQIDTVAGEWPCLTNYFYLTYDSVENDVTSTKDHVMVLGSGVYRIGSSVEFDCCAVGCARELNKLNVKTIMVNCNPETVSTDYDVCNRLYFEDISLETVLDICEFECLFGVIISMGGQLPNNIALQLHLQNINILGTPPVSIDSAENRYKFSRMLDQMNISQPVWKKVTTFEESVKFCNEIEYPCLIRPSYVLSGAAMNVAGSDEDLAVYLNEAAAISKEYPVVITKFIKDAKEIDVDTVCSDGRLIAMAISSHVENAGVHSGDATLITPPDDITQQDEIKSIVKSIAEKLFISGPLNMQIIIKDGDLKVIECNLRCSRSFPFVSKVLGYDFIAAATKAIMGEHLESVNIPDYNSLKKVGIKVPVFSHSQLPNSDVVRGVEMMSTGEVGCFGYDKYEAFLKGLMSSGFSIPRKNILLSIDDIKIRTTLMPYVLILTELGFNLYASSQTAYFFKEIGINITVMDECGDVEKFIRESNIELSIDIPSMFSHSFNNGHKLRRYIVDYSIPIITDLNCAILFIKALQKHPQSPRMNSMLDSITSYNIIQLPGFIDVHTHMREPGGEYKETIESGTAAAIAGGITMVFMMPNTNPAVVDHVTFNLVRNLAKKNARCDYGILFCANANNADEISQFAELSATLKIYMNETFTSYQLSTMTSWMEHFQKWPKKLPICCHAEGHTTAAAILMAQLCNRPVHICHVATKQEIEIIRQAKKSGIQVTCEVSPTHLFLSTSNTGKTNQNSMYNVRPRLVSEEDQKALWDNLEYIDCFATDHAPHTFSEKTGLNAPPGFPGLETMLPLLLTAVHQNLLTIDDIVKRLYSNPMRIFHLPVQEDTYVEIDFDKKWTIPDRPKFSKAQWTPFAGWEVQGMISKVTLRGKLIYSDGVMIGEPGYGENIRSIHSVSESVSKVTIPPSLHISIDSKKPRFRTVSECSVENLYLKNVYSSSQFTKDQLSDIMNLAHNYRVQNLSNKPVEPILQGRVAALMFYEASTRTSCSFASAMQRLGGSCIFYNDSTSSSQKGETLEDSVRTVAAYADVLIVRHPQKGIIKDKMMNIGKPIINAGDGNGEHPTQALLDIFTIREEIGTVNGIIITICGDLKNSRTVHSLVKLLTHYRSTIVYVPIQGLEIPKDVYEYAESHGIKQKVVDSIDQVIGETDVLYQTRIQKERIPSSEKYDSQVITSHLLMKAKSNMRIMHPLPRVDEISTSVDTDYRAAYFRQAENGLYIRMALLTKILSK